MACISLVRQATHPIAVEMSLECDMPWQNDKVCHTYYKLTHWGRVTHICVGKLTIIGSDNGLSPGRRQAIIWTNAGILLIGPLGTNFSEIWIAIETFSFKKMHLKIPSAKWRPFCLGLNVLNPRLNTDNPGICCPYSYHMADPLGILGPLPLLFPLLLALTALLKPTVALVSATVCGGASAGPYLAGTGGFTAQRWVCLGNMRAVFQKRENHFEATGLVFY